MATSINYLTKVIFVPQADLVDLGDNVYEFDVEAWRLELISLEDSEDGMNEDRTHIHNTEVVLSGDTYVRFVQITNGYTVEFEDGQYTVKCVGANNNLADVKVQNQVGINPGNSAGHTKIAVKQPALQRI